MEQIHPRAERSAASRIVPSRSYSERHKQIASLSDNNGNRAFNLLSYLFHCCRISDSLFPTSVFDARFRRSSFSTARQTLLINAVHTFPTSDVFLPLSMRNTVQNREIAACRDTTSHTTESRIVVDETRKPQGRWIKRTVIALCKSCPFSIKGSRIAPSWISCSRDQHLTRSNWKLVMENLLCAYISPGRFRDNRETRFQDQLLGTVVGMSDCCQASAYWISGWNEKNRWESRSLFFEIHPSENSRVISTPIFPNGRKVGLSRKSLCFLVLFQRFHRCNT